jgi:protein gp37
MGARTGIEWAHSTVNIWEGCSKVSPACKHCYAEINSPVRAMEMRIGEALQVEPSQDGKRRLKMWGVNGFRYETANWERELRRLNRKAANAELDAGIGGALRQYERPRIFINSLSDTFEDWKGPVYRLDDGKPAVVAQSLDDVRARFFRVAEECTELDILLLTKRPENVLRMTPGHWTSPSFGCTWPSHIWMLTTVEDQEHANKRIPELLKIPAKVRGLSVEPLLGKVDLSRWATLRSDGKLLCCECCYKDGCDEPRHYYRRNCPHCKGTGALTTGLDWVIVGGESGHGARPMHPDWVRSIRDQCVVAGVPFFFKQHGEWGPILDRDKEDPDWRYDYAITKRDQEHYRTINLAGGQGFHGDRLYVMRKLGKKNAGRVLDGRTWNEVPK